MRAPINRYVASANAVGVGIAVIQAFTLSVESATPSRWLMQPVDDAPSANASNNVSNVYFAVRPLISQIEQLSELQENWDGPGSVRPSQSTIDAALDFVKSIPASVRPPELSCAGDGEISLLWRQEDVFIDISIWGDKASAFANLDGHSFKVRSMQTLKDLPAVVLRAISGF